MTESEADAQRIAVVLRRRDARLRLKLRAQAALGLPLTLIGPVVLGTIFWLALRSMGGIVLPWSHVCGVALLVVVPLLIHLESRTGGDFLGTALREGGQGTDAIWPTSGLYVALGGFARAPALANPRGFSAGMTEVFLCGPRLLVGAFRQRRLRRRLGAVDELRAALVAHARARP